MRSMEDNFYGALAWILVLPFLPLIVLLGLYIGLTYHWEDTVPSQEDLDYESKGDE